MRKIVLWLASTVTVVVLLFGYHTSTNAPAATPPTSTASSASSSPAASGSGSSSGAETGSAPPSSGSSAPPASTTSGSGTFTGDVVQTRWGPVQVQITAASGKVTAVHVLQYPSENPRDQEINARALPTLVSETVAAQSADIDMVSGATVTSGGYLQSLQAALDQAGI